MKNIIRPDFLETAGSLMESLLKIIKIFLFLLLILLGLMVSTKAVNGQACPDYYSCINEPDPLICANDSGLLMDCTLPGGGIGNCCMPIVPQQQCFISCPNPAPDGEGCYSCTGNPGDMQCQLIGMGNCHIGALPPFGNYGSCIPSNGFQCGCDNYPCYLNVGIGCGAYAESMDAWSQYASCYPGLTCTKEIPTPGLGLIPVDEPCPDDPSELLPGEQCGCNPPFQPPPGGPYYCFREGSTCLCNCPEGFEPTDPYCISNWEAQCSLEECGCHNPFVCHGYISDTAGECYFLECPSGTYMEGFNPQPPFPPFDTLPETQCPLLHACCTSPDPEWLERNALHVECTTPNGATGINTAAGCIPVNTQIGFLSFILPWAIGVGGGTAFILIIVAGFLILTSAGDQQRLKAGKDLLTASIIGLLMIIFSVYILDLIGLKILRLPGL